MTSKLYIPGLAEYGQCKAAFLRTQELLAQESTDEHKKELSDLLQTLDKTPDAVDFLKAEFGQEYARVHEQLEKAAVSSFLLDEQAADNGRKRLPNEWPDYWNNIHDGRVMASMGNLYESFKIIKKMHDGTEQEKMKAKSLLFSLRDDFDWLGKSNRLISSTRPIYSEGNSLDARIVQHYRCNQPEVTKETALVIPVYRGVPIENIVSEKAGLAYMQTLFDKQDEGETIIQTLEFVSGKNRTNIAGWTAAVSANDSPYTRAGHPERAAGFDYGYDQFRVLGLNFSSSPGCSRGVRRGCARMARDEK